MALNITPNAASQIAKLPPFFRVSVQGGGCKGFQYQFESGASPLEDDHVVVLEEGGAVHIDATSFPFLKDSTLDYVNELIGSHFHIRNPQAEGSCGCGNSFSV